MSLRRVFALLCVFFSVAAMGQEYPTKPIRLVTPWPPGGGTDIVARMIAAKLTDAWGQQVVVENKSGATGTIGTDMVAKSAPDGYTLIIGTNATHVIAVSLYAKLPYDQEKDLTPITRVSAVPHVIAVVPSLEARNVQELIALAKAHPGKISFGSAGNGSTPHLAGELFKTLTGVNLLHVPYKGTGQSLQDTIGGVVQVSFDTMPSVLPHIKSGRLRALAIAGPKRVSALPDVPAVAEAGVPGAEGMTWYGLFGPAGLPKPIVQKIFAEVVRIVKLPDVKSRLDSLGTEETTSASPQEFAAMVHSDIAKYAKVIKSAGLRMD
ncbi:MAG: tripartite tricarboxylate transporter substrate binding protein [Betaproteobacteria bacterium]|nr:MAG: tripartite tricarboxylate transporter substrate binding protein [Betaproteobacteria bacterium]